jgi:arginase
MREWALVGVPSSAGAHHAGQERAPQALREAGLATRLRAGGLVMDDLGDLNETSFRVDSEHPSRRNLPAVVQVAREVSDVVADVLASGRTPLVLGGDCTITLGAVAGFRRRHLGVGLVYVDGDADLSTPEAPEAPGSGIFDSMGVAHLLGGGAPELAGFAGPPSLLAARRLALVGGDPRETDDAGRQFLADRGISFQEAPALRADPVAVAERALAAVADDGGPILVHFDVDVVDSGDLPLGNFPHYGSGVAFTQAIECLRVLRAHPQFAGLVLTEVNPTHDADGTLIARYVAGIAGALTGTGPYG